MPRNVGRKPVWRYPKVAGFNPPERWGHSACYYDGVLYVFGGCCGGLHFSDVLTLNLKTMAWSSLVTRGEQPGTRDSHSVVVFGDTMVIFGGTNGSNKVNDLHILNLQSREWTRPAAQGTPPSPRESHSATLVGDGRMVIFGGSGEGEGNYLNDVHILDLKAMKWSSPEVSGEPPAKRDSHTAVAIGNRLVVYGGDCGDHYLGEVDVLDLATFTWSRLGAEVRGAVDGVFDSGYLMTAHVNGQLFRGLLFSPGPGVGAREPNVAASYVPNSAGLILAHPQHPLASQQAQNPACLKAAFVGAPIMPNMHVGTVLQPASLARTAPAEGSASTIMVKSPGFPPQMDVQVRPTQDHRYSARPNFVPSRRVSNGTLHQLKIGSTAETASGNGSVQSVTSGHGQWVWQPGPQVDFPRRDNTHFVAHPLPGLSCVAAQPANGSLTRGSSVQMLGNGATIPDLQGVTLRLGSSGPQIGGVQKH